MNPDNPILGMAYYSLMNALELYQKKEDEERHRFGAIILMDLSIEYLLKAKLYQINAVDFIEKQQELGFADLMKMDDKKIGFIAKEKTYLMKVHKARNLSQHRGSITDSLFSEEYMRWLCQFVDRFAKDNFGSKVIELLPIEYKITWQKLIKNGIKINTNYNLKTPLEENYATVKGWLNFRSRNSNRGYISTDYKNSLIWSLRQYCNYKKMDPDNLISYANQGLLSPNEDIKEFLQMLPTAKMPPYVVLKSFYKFNGIKITEIPYPRYHPQGTVKEISTVQIKRLCELAEDAGDIEAKSWILANSYMGLSVGKLALLKVQDFHTDGWNNEKLIYPVKIRKEVSNTFDYTTFIGIDAKNELQKYFGTKQFSQGDHPWNRQRHCDFNDMFRKYAVKLKIYEKRRMAPKSLAKRLKRILEESGMRADWVYYILGSTPDKISMRKIDSPLDEELAKSYEVAFPKLRIF